MHTTGSKLCIEKTWIYTKKKTLRYKEQNPIRVEEYKNEIKDIPNSKIVYIDETCIDTYIYREYCYAKKGEKLIGYIKGRKYKRVGIVAAKLENKILSPLQYDGTMNSVLFEKWFENRLMGEFPDNVVIVMDNASFHRKSRLTSITKKYGHRIIFFPPYSPELNPIEKFWALLKAGLKKCIHQFSTFDGALWNAFNFV